MPRTKPPAYDPSDRDPRAVLSAWLAAESPAPLRVSSPASALAVVLPHLTGPDGAILPDEHLVAVALGPRNAVLASAVLTRGSHRYTVVDPAQLFRWALTAGPRPATAVILAHNHPSGDPEPSPEDHDVTRRCAAAGRVLGIFVVDHLVVASAGRFTSFAERGLLGA